MKKIFHAALIALTAIACEAADVRVMIPLYSYPSWYSAADYPWTNVTAAASNIPVTVIVNANNGPDGGAPNSDYVHGLADLRAAGVTILGYVYTSYGARTFTNVAADIDLYDRFWNIHGIFLDEADNTTNTLAYYGQLHDYIKSRTNLSQVVINPGINTVEGFIARPACDTAIIFENDTGWTNYAADAYVAHYPPARFAMLVHSNLTASAMRQSIDLAARRNIGWVFITDDAPPNPWDKFPAWWKEEVDYVRQLRAFQFTAIAPANGAVALHLNTITNRTIAIESAASLTSWTPLTNIAGNGTATNISTAPAAMRFFRASF